MRSIHYIIIQIIAIFSFFGVMAQEQTQSFFDCTTWNFGDVYEEKGRVEHTFSLKNTTSKPIVILDVMSGCGCTIPSYSRKPVLSGQKGEIKVSFDPTNRPGKFSKGVSVLTSASNKPITLMLEGVVIPREKSVEELYPFDLGSGVRLTANFHSFAYVGRGESVSESIGWINTSSRDAAIKLLPKQVSGLAQISIPLVMKAGERGEILLKYEVGESSSRYGTLEDMWGVAVNGRESNIVLTINAVAVDKYDNATDDISQPSGELSKKFIKFGDVKQGKVVTNATVLLVNDGESDLIIRAVEWNTDALDCSLKAGDRVASGGQLAIKLTLNTSGCNYGVWVDKLRIITNDPSRPMQTLRVTAIVVD